MNLWTWNWPASWDIFITQQVLYLVNTIDLHQVVESVIEIVEHADDVHRLNGGGDVRERYDITEQNRHWWKLLCKILKRMIGCIVRWITLLKGNFSRSDI